MKMLKEEVDRENNSPADIIPYAAALDTSGNIQLVDLWESEQDFTNYFSSKLKACFHKIKRFNYKILSSTFMSDKERIDREHVEKIFKSLEKTYPNSFALFTQISNNFSKIYAEVNSDAKFDEGETKYVTVGVGLDEQGNPRLAMGESAAIFYAAMAHTILELIQRMVLPEKKMKDLENGHILENKGCPKCGATNKITEETCSNCGTKLH